MRVSASDYRRVLDLLHAVGDAQTPEDFAERSLSGLSTLVPSEIISLNEVEPDAGRFEFSVHPFDFPVPEGSEETLARYADQHPLIAEFERTGDGSARKVSDLVTEEQWHAHPLYLAYYAPLGVEFQIAITLAAPRPTTVAYALNRGGSDFDERDRAVLDLARPHLAQTWRAARDRARLTRMLTSTSAAVEAEGVGVLLLDDPPVEVTRGILLEIFRFFGRPAAVGVLPTAVRRWVDAQRAHLAAGELLRPLTGTLGESRLVLRLVPGSAGTADAVIARRAEARAVDRRLTDVGLSAREAEVLRLVGTGATNAAIAAELHVAPSTVKKHLDSIYRKLGVSGRLRAVAAATEILGHHLP